MPEYENSRLQRLRIVLVSFLMLLIGAVFNVPGANGQDETGSESPLDLPIIEEPAAIPPSDPPTETEESPASKADPVAADNPPETPPPSEPEPAKKDVSNETEKHEPPYDKETQEESTPSTGTSLGMNRDHGQVEIDSSRYHLAGNADHREFRELSLNIRPGFAKTTSDPIGNAETAFSIGTAVQYFVYRYLGLNVPYNYAHYGSGLEVHRMGGGPVVRFLDYGPLRASFDGNFLYYRLLGSNRLGWSVGGDVTLGFRSGTYRPFFGPFFRYETAYLPGDNFGAYSIGLSVSLTGFSDLD